MQNWLLQNLSDVLNKELQADSPDLGETNPHAQKETKDSKVQKRHSEKNRLAKSRAKREWNGAIASVEKLLLSEVNLNKATTDNGKQGLIFSGPVPLLSHSDLVNSFQSAVFTTDAFSANVLMPSRHSIANNQAVDHDAAPVIKLPLIPQDPIAKEQFCLVLTPRFGLIMVLGKDAEGTAKFFFSFAPSTIGEIWATLRSRLVITNYHYLEQLDSLIEHFSPPNPDYRLVASFSRQLLELMPEPTTISIPKTRSVDAVNAASELEQLKSALTTKGQTSQIEMELLQALTHEVRTPLTTIRTLTKLLLKRTKDFKPNVVQRLQTIDRECTEQIERMELIFRAAELESAPMEKSVQLVHFSLDQVFMQSIPRWQEKAKRRNVDLKFTLPQILPKVVSDPGMLDTVLTGLIESCTRSLPTGGKVDVKVSTAGNQLKLQVLSQVSSNIDNPLKSLGQLLNFQPATGCLSLNLDVTKNIFQALGGKLTVRQRQEQGKELTIFLPLEKANQEAKQNSVEV